MIDRFINFLRSLRAAVGGLSIIVIASVLGTLIPQQKTFEFYTQEYGSLAGKLVWHTGFSDLYHNVWFTALLAWVLTSMVVCSIFHLKHVLLKKEAAGPDDIDSQYDEVLRVSTECTGNNLPAEKVTEFVDRLSQRLRYRLYRVSKTEGTGSEYLLAAEKGSYGRFGAFVIHWGCIIVLSGGLLSMLLSTTHKLPLGEQDTIDVPGTPYRILLHDFSIEKYSGTTKKGKELHKGYHSRISILDKGGKAADGTIEINAPFIFKGYRFYQMDYRTAVREVAVKLERATGNRQAQEYRLRIGEEVNLPELGLKIKAAEFLPDFVFHKGKASSRSEEFKNPAVRLQLSAEDGASADKWVFPDMSGSFHKGGKKFPYRARLASYEPRYSIGLKIVRDRGRPVIYFGYVVLIIGTLLSCAVFHRRLFVRVIHKEQSVLVNFVGGTRRNRIDFEDEINKLRLFVEQTLRQR